VKLSDQLVAVKRIIRLLYKAAWKRYCQNPKILYSAFFGSLITNLLLLQKFFLTHLILNFPFKFGEQTLFVNGNFCFHQFDSPTSTVFTDLPGAVK